MKRRWWMIALGLLVVVVIGLSLRPSGPEIRVLSPTVGPIVESFREPGRTRLEDTWIVSMPVTGRIGRIDLEPGDRVEKGQSLAEFDLVPLNAAVREAEARISQLQVTLNLLDDNRIEKTNMSEAEEQVEAAREAVAAAQSRVNSARARVERTRKELERVLSMQKEGIIAQARVDDAALDAETAELDLQRSQSDLLAAQAQLRALQLSPTRIQDNLDLEGLKREEVLAQITQAEALLSRAEHDLQLANLRSPIDGIVLKRMHRGEATLPAGTELVELGRPEDIEVIVDVLTQDAVKLAPGTHVELESSGSSLMRTGKVTRIEPQGFTKYSSLGVEQQRVNVVVSLDAPATADADLGTLGVNYRLHARFFTGQSEDALVVPRFSVLQAPDESHYVFKLVDNELVRQTVELGLRSDLLIEITSGLTEEDQIVRAPDSTMKPGEPARPLVDTPDSDIQ